MKYLKGTLGVGFFILILGGASMDAFGFLGFGGTSWQEEVVLHDGGRIVVMRTQSYGGKREIGQTPPIKEQEIAFTLPGTSKTITWKSEYSEDVGRANFKLLALHILDGTSYVVAAPNLCLSYNKWGRPNPPYVFFKYISEAWQRIAISEFPAQFRDINVVIDTKTNEKTITDQLPVPSELVRKLNNRLTQPEYKTILREPVPPRSYGSSVNCEELIPFGKAGWLGLDWFKEQPSYETCVKFCEKKGVNPEHCPCDRIFGRK